MFWKPGWKFGIKILKPAVNAVFSSGIQFSFKVVSHILSFFSLNVFPFWQQNTKNYLYFYY